MCAQGIEIKFLEKKGTSIDEIGLLIAHYYLYLKQKHNTAYHEFVMEFP